MDDISDKDLNTFLDFLMKCSKGVDPRDPIKWFDLDDEPLPKPLEMWYKLHPTIVIPKSN